MDEMSCDDAPIVLNLVACDTALARVFSKAWRTEVRPSDVGFRGSKRCLKVVENLDGGYQWQPVLSLVQPGVLGSLRSGSWRGPILRWSPTASLATQAEAFAVARRALVYP
jgi:hypothetical protein